MILELQGTDGVGNLLHRILNGMGEIIHRVNAPSIPRIVVRHMRHAVNNRVAHVDIRGGHVNLGPQYLLPVFHLTLFHLFKQTQVLLHAAVAVGAVLPRLRQRAPVFPNFIRA